MNRPFLVAVTASVLVAASSCSASNVNEPEGSSSAESPPAPVSGREVCGGVLGEAGGDALARLTGQPYASPVSGNGGAEIKRTAAQMRNAPSDVASGHKRQFSSVCTFRAPPRTVESQEVDLKYGWTEVPRGDEGYHKYYSTDSALFDVGYKNFDDVSIYYPCEVKSGNMGVVRGNFQARWAPEDLETQEQDSSYAQILLAVSSEMSENLGCANKPDLSPTSKIKKMYSGDKMANSPTRIEVSDLPKQLRKFR